MPCCVKQIGGRLAGTAPLLARQLIVPITQFRMGVTAPVETTVGTTPSVPVLRFTAVNELVSTFAQMPTNWDRTVDVDLVLAIQLVNLEIDLDVLDLTVDYVVPIFNLTGNGVAKASTQVLSAVQVTAPNGLAAGDAYEARATFPSADATNPFTSEDAVGFGFEIHMTNIVGVAAFDLLSTCLSYRALP